MAASVLPLFIVLEGIDGAGTTTQTELLARFLASRGRRAIATREPSPGPVGRLLREILHGQHRHAAGAVAPETLALLFAADRRDHLAREIEPALRSGMDVVCDRYQWSSIVYQASESVPEQWIAELGRGIRAPDLTILLDVPAAVAARRRQLAGRPTERYDSDQIQNRVAEHYRRLVRGTPNSWLVDGSADVEAVTQAIVAVVEPMLQS